MGYILDQSGLSTDHTSWGSFDRVDYAVLTTYSTAIIESLFRVDFRNAKYIKENTLTAEHIQGANCIDSFVETHAFDFSL